MLTWQKCMRNTTRVLGTQALPRHGWFHSDSVTLWLSDYVDLNLCTFYRNALYTPDWLLYFGDPGAAVAHQVEHVYLRWQRCAQWPPFFLELIPANRWSASVWLAHTHNERTSWLSHRSIMVRFYTNVLCGCCGLREAFTDGHLSRQYL